MSAFFQTVLWVGLIVWTLRRFEKVIATLFAAVTKRIEDGDELAAPGGFRIGVRQSTPEEQKIRLREEAEAISRTERMETPARSGPSVSDDESANDVGASRTSPSIKSSLQTAVRDVSDARALGVKWLAMTMGAHFIPDVTFDGHVYDGLITPSGGRHCLVWVRLVNDVNQLASISEQARALAEDTKGARVSVVLVASGAAIGTSMWQLLPLDVQAAFEWHEIDLPQLRRIYGLNAPES